MKKRLLAFAAAILAMGLPASCSKSGRDVDPVSDGSKKFVVLSDIHLMHPDLLVNEGEAFEKYNWEECKLLRERPEITILPTLIHSDITGPCQRRSQAPPKRISSRYMPVAAIMTPWRAGRGSFWQHPIRLAIVVSDALR